ncbi:hypothetical protein XA68_12409 [Ophiocordyceps unilateralis]|uniref:Serine hydrolase domain-containing protein n=1 Tax=Ophiocordyceps unilateralis TaxID=268505 RepID=A0A2A9P1W2_OPHUN|nr:hypothetical protein XA68_12409 [Ophiocordyceps unilateralis]
MRALENLANYVDQEGPFDGAMGFSHGASLIATYLLQCQQTQPFKCAIFLSASRPYDVAALSTGVLRYADPDPDRRPLLSLPTTHIWGSRDDAYGDQCNVLVAMSDEAKRNVYIHKGGHEIPGPRAKDDVQGCVRAIRRVIERASLDA